MSSVLVIHEVQNSETEFYTVMLLYYSSSGGAVDRMTACALYSSCLVVCPPF